jgi:uncharacterized protein YidB (DUF937 family)
MSSLDEVLGGVLGQRAASGSGGGQSAAVQALLPAVTGLLAGGGLSKLLDAFKANGLGEQADSWVATGENKPISASDVQRVVGQERIAQVANEANISKDQATDVLAEAIPAAVDHATPDGVAPDPAKVDERLQAVTLN